jgi:AraC-like DNA-binding protein
MSNVIFPLLNFVAIASLLIIANLVWRKDRQQHHILLAILVLFVAFEPMVITMRNNMSYQLPVFLCAQAIPLLFGPVLLQYLQTLHAEKKRKTNLMALLPGMVILGLALFSVLPIGHHSFHSMVITHHSLVLGMITVILGAQVLSMCYYLRKAYQFHQQHRTNTSSIWMNTLLQIGGLFLMASLLPFVAFLIHHFIDEAQWLSSISILSPVVVVALLTYHLVSSGLSGKTFVVGKSRSQQLSHHQTLLLVQQLEMSMKQHRYYLDQELTLPVLASKLSVPVNTLSYVINEHYNIGFSDLINKYRVQEFIACLHADQHQNYSILGIATEAGFKSKSVFYKAFKKHTQTTPSAYIKTLKKPLDLS